MIKSLMFILLMVPASSFATAVDNQGIENCAYDAALGTLKVVKAKGLLKTFMQISALEDFVQSICAPNGGNVTFNRDQYSPVVHRALVKAIIEVYPDAWGEAKPAPLEPSQFGKVK